jgi:serine/threonine-protein kinase RsbW
VSDAGLSTRPDSGAGPAGAGNGLRDVVDIVLPASSAYLTVLRTAAAGLAARLDFTLDEIEDLRIAVDEACAMLLPHSGDAVRMRCSFELADDALDITVSVPREVGSLPSRETFAWTVLTSLAGDVDAGEGDEGIWIRMRKRRGLPAQGRADGMS